MTPADTTEFAKIITVLWAVYGKGNISNIIISFYFAALNQYSIEQIKQASTEIAKTRVYDGMPKPGEFVEKIEGTKEQKALTAWVEFVKALRHKGTYQSIEFGDPIIHSVIATMGGWPECHDWLEIDLKWKEKEFVKYYTIMEKRTDHPPYMIGRTERENSTSGHLSFAKDNQKNRILVGFERKQLTGGENET